MSPDHLRPHDLAGLRRAGIVPIPFESSEPFIPASVRQREEFVLCVQCSAGTHRHAAVLAAGGEAVCSFGNERHGETVHLDVALPQSLDLGACAFPSTQTGGIA